MIRSLVHSATAKREQVSEFLRDCERRWQTAVAWQPKGFGLFDAPEIATTGFAVTRGAHSGGCRACPRGG